MDSILTLNTEYGHSGRRPTSAAPNKTAEQAVQKFLSRKRRIIFGFACIMGFCCYFPYDAPASINTQLKMHLNLTETQFMYFYQAYCIPSAIMTILSGYIIDVQVGLRNSAALFSFGVVVTQIFLAVAAYNDSYTGMVIGRFLAGFVSEPLGVARTKYVAKHAPSALTFGICLACSRFGSVASFNILGLIYDYVEVISVTQAITAIFGMTTVVCFLGFIVSLILFRLDKNVSRIQHQRSQISTSSSDPRDTAVSIVDMSAEDYSKFRKEFWYMLVISILFYMSIFPFVSIGPGWFKRIYSLSDKQSRFITSLPYIMSMFLTPFVGLMVDKTRHHLAWIMGATAFAWIGHTFLVYLQNFDIAAWLGMSFIGIAYSTMAATLTPMVAFLVPVSLSATAFGMIFGAQSIAIAFTCPVVGKIRDADWGGDSVVSKFFILVLTLGLLCEVLLVRICGFDPKSKIAYRPNEACGYRAGVELTSRNESNPSHRLSEYRGSEFPVNFPRNFSELVPINEMDKGKNDNIVRQRSASSEKE